MPLPYRVILDLLGCPTTKHRVPVATGCGEGGGTSARLHHRLPSHTLENSRLPDEGFWFFVVLSVNNVLIDSGKDPHQCYFSTPTWIEVRFSGYRRDSGERKERERDRREKEMRTGLSYSLLYGALPFDFTSNTSSDRLHFTRRIRELHSREIPYPFNL